jgi:hypothetical protein
MLIVEVKHRMDNGRGVIETLETLWKGGDEKKKR